MPKGSFSPRGCSGNSLLGTPSEPVWELFPRTPSRTFSEPFLETCVVVRSLRRAPYPYRHQGNCPKPKHVNGKKYQKIIETCGWKWGKMTPNMAKTCKNDLKMTSNPIFPSFWSPCPAMCDLRFWVIFPTFGFGHVFPGPWSSMCNALSKIAQPQRQQNRHRTQKHDSQRLDRILRMRLRLEIRQFSPDLGAVSLPNSRKTWRRNKKENVPCRTKTPQNCRFLSLVVVERVLITDTYLSVWASLFAKCITIAHMS